ncbi:uncharacterized protein METZ01_LOCUS350275, partial [marine metagenome]
MNRYISASILFVFSLLLSSDFNGSEIPVQENGRIKPLDTFARNQLLSMYTKGTLKKDALPSDIDKSKMSAVDWLYDIALHPE